MEKSPHLDLVLAASGGSLFVNLATVAQLTGWSQKSLRNRPESFPLPFRKIGKRVGISAMQLAEMLDEIAGLAPARRVVTAPSRPRGRPRKVARQEGGGV